jgi:hypothetical protein
MVRERQGSFIVRLDRNDDRRLGAEEFEAPPKDFISLGMEKWVVSICDYTQVWLEHSLRLGCIAQNLTQLSNNRLLLDNAQ